MINDKYFPLLEVDRGDFIDLSRIESLSFSSNFHGNHLVFIVCFFIHGKENFYQFGVDSRIEWEEKKNEILTLVARAKPQCSKPIVENSPKNSSIWKTINSAPKDGRTLILATVDINGDLEEINMGFFGATSKAWIDIVCSKTLNPTHWTSQFIETN